MFITNMSKSIWKNSYLKASRALRDGRNTNPAHKDALNSLISDLKKKNLQGDRKSVGDHDSTTRALFMEENTDGEIWFLFIWYSQYTFYIYITQRYF